MWIPNFILKLVGRKIAQEAKLEEGPVDQTKPWYRSVTIWSDVFTIATGVIAFVDKDFGTQIAANHWYQVILTVLGGVGIYGRASADQKIG